MAIARLVRYNDQTESFRFKLLDVAKKNDQRAREEIEQYSIENKLPRPVRDQGFRIAVREAYDYRCTACGIRVITPDAHVLVQGAHIHAWSESADDRIVNGLALCHTCHWGFDEGLWTIDDNLVIKTSPILAWNTNVSGYLGTLDARSLMQPKEALFRPDAESLAWHRKERYRSGI